MNLKALRKMFKRPISLQVKQHHKHVKPMHRASTTMSANAD